MSDYWISFATDGACLGVCIVTATSHAAAILIASLLGINPGGEAMISAMPDTEIARNEAARYGRNRLITTAELKSGGAKKIKDLPQETQDKLQSRVAACEFCNEENHTNE